ncbi:MAG: hypothetical protein JSV47_04920 [Deltaproteobacteria bacterium]|nr:MAG: hypothetical protein JSV47_04920 [Deltaproteobacteria bacterium]
MRLKQIEFFRLQIQLCMPIKHHLAEHTYSENLVVKVVTDSGVAGYGEGVARQYVTGETTDASLSFLRDYLIPRINGYGATDPADLMQTFTDLVPSHQRIQAPAACCALELAIFDAAGKTWGLSLTDLLGGTNQPFVYSAIIPMMDHASFQRLLSLIRDQRMAFVKIKVGNNKDLEILSQVRQTLGEEVDLRVDANGAWSAEQAEERIAAMMVYGISAVEQPVAKENFHGLKRVSESVPIPVIADESVCFEQDAENLASQEACQIFNLRLSKCGGILAAARIYEIGRKKGINAQLGCQVGETGILAAAGRHLATSLELLYHEGSYASYLLEEDIVNEPVSFGLGGLAQPLAGHGLGVTVNEDALQRLAVLHEKISIL